jgi:hypothetical protein
MTVIVREAPSQNLTCDFSTERFPKKVVFRQKFMGCQHENSLIKMLHGKNQAYSLRPECAIIKGVNHQGQNTTALIHLSPAVKNPQQRHQSNNLRGFCQTLSIYPKASSACPQNFCSG